MRTRSREDTAKAQGRTAATSTAPTQERQDILPFLVLAATRRTRQVTDCAVLRHIGLPAAASAARLHNARPGYDGQPAVYSYIAGLEMNVLNCPEASAPSGRGPRQIWLTC